MFYTPIPELAKELWTDNDDVIFIQLLEEVISYRDCGPIHNIWLNCGHIFVTLNNGKKLITFDCKTADLIQDEERSGCLDLDLNYPVIEILTWSKNGVIIVVENGELLHWMFGPDYKWLKQTKLYLCKSVGGSVVSVCLNVTQSSLYWCEKTYREDTESFTIYKRPIKHDEDKKSCLKLGPTTTLIKNCCTGKLYTRGHGCIYIPSSGELCLVLSTLTGAIEVIVNSERRTVVDLNLHTPVLYSHIVLTCISQLNRVKTMPVLLKTCYIHSSQILLQLYSDGRVWAITNSAESDSLLLNLKDDDMSGVTSLLSVHECVGLVLKSEIRVFSLKTGVPVYRLSTEDQTDIEGACESMFGSHQIGLYTENNLYFIQRERSHRQMDEQSIINSGQYQSPAIQLSYLERMRKTSYDSTSVKAIEQMKREWQMSNRQHPASKLAEIVDPYLQEYWKLEEMLTEKCDNPSTIADMDKTSVRHEVDNLLDPTSKLTNSGRQSQLHLLSESHPREVLDSLLERFDLNSDELSTSQSHKWQCILAPETANLAGSCDIPVPLFELLTHLLYKHKPGLLMKFLHQGQKAWDKKLGMSAFIRRKQNLLIYERALKCISEPRLSSDEGTALLVHLHIILTSEIEGCYLKAIRMLLKYEKWFEVIELYKERKDNSKQNVLIYQMIITALTKSKVLHKYADQIFPLMPSISCTDVMKKGDSTEQSPSVLCEDADSITMKTIKPFLINSIKQTVKQDSE